MASFVEIDRYNLIPLSVTSLYGCSCRPLSNKTLTLTRRAPKLKLNFVFHGSESVFLLRPTRIYINRRLITAVARAEPESIDESNSKEVPLVLVVHIFVSVISSELYLVNLELDFETFE